MILRSLENSPTTFFRCALAGLSLGPLLLASSGRAQTTIQPVELLSSYLQINGTTAQGEHQAAALLAEELHRHGIATQLLVGPTGRPNLYAEVGPKDFPAILLLHHLDVVPARDEDWTVPPFSGEIRSGFNINSVDQGPEIWGRGAIDSKGLGVAHLAAFIDAIQRQNPRTRLIFLATADEESGGEEGLAWVTAAYPHLFDEVAVALTEGGVNRVLSEGLLWWGVEFEQKRPLWLRATFRGRASHGAKLNLNTAPKNLARALAALADRPRNYRTTPAVETYLRGIEAKLGSPRGPSMDRIQQAIDNGTAETVLRLGQHQLFLDTIQVTQLEAGSAVNVVPATAHATLDARLLPDTSQEEFLGEVRTILGKGVGLEILHSSPPVPAVSTSGIWWQAIEDALGENTPVVPVMISGATDARYLRQMGISTYGLSPFLYPPEVRQGIHGVDERVPVDEFEQGVARMKRVVAALLAAVANQTRPVETSAR